MASTEHDFGDVVYARSGPENTENTKEVRRDRDGRPIHTLAQYALERSKGVIAIDRVLKAHKCRALRPKLDYLGEFEHNRVNEIDARCWMYDHTSEILASDRNGKHDEVTHCDQQVKIALERASKGELEPLDPETKEVMEYWGVASKFMTVPVAWEAFFDQTIFNRPGSRDLAPDAEHCGPWDEPLPPTCLKAPPPVGFDSWAAFNDVLIEARVSPATSCKAKRKDSAIGRACKAALKKTAKIVKRMSFASRSGKSSRESSLARSTQSSVESSGFTPVSSQASSQRTASDVIEKTPKDVV